MAHRNPPDSGTASLVESYPVPPGRTTLDAIAAIPEEHVWLASRKSPRTRRAYRQDVEHFMRTVGIRSVDELRVMDHRAVLAWEAYMREGEFAEASTIRRRLAALSSLFKHLIKHGVADRNPVQDVERPPINRQESSTLAFTKARVPHPSRSDGWGHDDQTSKIHEALNSHRKPPQPRPGNGSTRPNTIHSTNRTPSFIILSIL